MIARRLPVAAFKHNPDSRVQPMQNVTLAHTTFPVVPARSGLCVTTRRPANP